MGWVVAMALLFGVSPRAAHAQGLEPQAAIAEVREHLLYARYEEATAATNALLERTDLTASQRNEVLEAKAIAELALDQPEAAQETLTALYARDPGHRLSDADASPTVQSAFARVREGRPDTVPVRLSHASPGTLANRESPRIAVTLDAGADAVEELRLAYRVSGESRFDTIVMRRVSSESAEARIPLLPEHDGAYVVEYFIQALAPSRTLIAQLGSRDDLYQLVVPGPAGAAPILVTSGAQTVAPREGGGGVLSSVWLWAAIVAVLGGGVAAYVLLGPPSEGPTEGTFGTAVLTLR